MCWSVMILRLDLALFVLGRVITAVLAQVALFASRFDLLRDIDAAPSGEVVELCLEPVKRLLGQPGDGLFTRLGHGYS